MNHYSAINDDIIDEMSQYINPADLAAFRRINRTSSQAPITFEQCCQEPTNVEIANLLLVPENRLYFSGTISFENPKLGTDPSRYKFIQLGRSGIIGKTYAKGADVFSRFFETKWKDKPLNSQKDILEFLSGSKLLLNFKFDSRNDEVYNNALNSLPINWIVFRDILDNRTGCLLRKFDPHQCFIHTLSSRYGSSANTRLEWYTVLRSLVRLLKPRTVERLEFDFTNDINIPYELELNNPRQSRLAGARNSKYEINPKKFNTWISNWLSKLSPDDY